MDEIESQFLGERKAARALELNSVIGSNADLTGHPGFGGSFERDDVGEGVVLKKIRVDPAHGLPVEKSDRKLTFRHRPEPDLVEVSEYAASFRAGNGKAGMAVMQVN